jgi:hypothetical protein
MEANEKKFWFPAKRYGWGWGPPNCWQGWAVMGVWLALLFGGSFILRPDHHMGLYLGFVMVMSVCLIAVCWWKGEKPGWRWGGK